MNQLFIFLQSVMTEAAATEAPKTVKSISYWELIQSGGWIMVPIALMSVVAVYIFVERYLAVRHASKLDVAFMDRIRDYIHEGKVEAALTLCQSTDHPLARMIEKGIRKIGRPIKEIEEAIEVVGKFEIYKLEKNLTVLAVIAAIAPMFGFIGTIVGVIKIFYNISLADNISIGIISQGLYQKMVASASGLLVGIIAYIGYHWLSILVDRIVHRIETNVMSFIDILQEPVK